MTSRPRPLAALQETRRLLGCILDSMAFCHRSSKIPLQAMSCPNTLQRSLDRLARMLGLVAVVSGRTVEFRSSTAYRLLGVQFSSPGRRTDHGWGTPE